MLRSFHLLLIVAVAASSTAEACINEYGTTASGIATLRAHSGVPIVIPIDIGRYREQIKILTPKIESSPSHEDLSDLAVAHLYVGETQRSIELLQQAESVTPGEYAVASNLGTALELAGRNEEALKWIEEGIRRNPDAHGGSEWVHANVLKAKAAMAEEPRWLKENSVTGLSFGDEPIPVFDTSLSSPNCPESLIDVRAHLEHQLHERRSFIPGPDPIVAALMFDLANATALAYTVEDSRPIYAAAVELGYHNQTLVSHRIAALEALQSRNILAGWTYETLALAATCTILVTVFLGVLLRRQVITRRSTNRAMQRIGGGAISDRGDSTPAAR